QCFSDIKAIQGLGVAARFGQICLICYDISIYTHLVISVNRFVSVYMPTRYNMIFTDRFTTVLISGIVLLSFCFSFVLVFLSCQMGFSIQRWMLDYATPPCDLNNVYYAEFLRGLIVISLFAIINCCTFIRMNFYNKKKASDCFIYLFIHMFVVVWCAHACKVNVRAATVIVEFHQP
ncbi:hypothetical protein COOONC_13285, partial [Cooperia oncophora]